MEEEFLSETYEDSLSDLAENESDSEDSDIQPIRKRVSVLRVLSSSSSEEEVEVEESDTDWSEFDPERCNEQFEGASGLKIFPNNPQSVADVTSLFIGEDLIEKIVYETNRYHNTNSQKYKKYDHGCKWVDVTVSEMKKVFGLILLMGSVRKNKIYNYWSTHPLLETPVFGTTMSRDRFLRICTFLHFSDNSTVHSKENRLIKVQEIIDYFSNKFKSVYDPGQNLSLDEGIIPWRGRLRFRIYNPNKIVKYGILNRMICESKTGYICSFILYCGKSVSLENTILKLLNPYLNKWHHIYTDNFYNSVKLASTLLLHKVRVCGTIRSNRGVPNVLKNIKLQHGETRYKRRGEIMVQVWNSKKKRNIQMISTIHNADMIDSNKIDRNTQLFIKKPHCIIDYNQYMNGVDLADQYLAYNPIFRKTVKWTKKVFFYFLHCAIFNSFRIYQILNSQSKIRFHDFMLNVAESWIEESADISHSSTEEATNEPSTSTRTPRFDSTKRLSGNIKHHELVKILSNGKTIKKRCRVCYSHKLRRDTSYMCRSCKVPLHIEKWFQAYHTKKKY